MRRFVEGADRGQTTLFPECLEDWIGADNTVRVIDVFVEELDLAGLGFGGVDPEATGRPSYHPSVLLKLYIYGTRHKHNDGTIGALVAGFYRSSLFTRLKPSSQRLYRSVLDKFSQEDGHRLVRDMPRRVARRIIEEIG